MVTLGGENDKNVVVETPSAETVIARRRRTQLKPRRNRIPKAIQEIRKEQAKCTWVIPRKTFLRIIKGIMDENNAGHMRIQTSAVDGLMSATESFIIERFGQADRLRVFCKSETLTAGHLKFIVAEHEKDE